MATIVYLDADDEITSAADANPPGGRTRAWPWCCRSGRASRRRGSTSGCSPARPMVNGRRLDIVAPDASARALAASAGLPVFGSVGEYEAALDIEDEAKDARRAEAWAAPGSGPRPEPRAQRAPRQKQAPRERRRRGRSGRRGAAGAAGAASAAGAAGAAGAAAAGAGVAAGAAPADPGADPPLPARPPRRRAHREASPARRDDRAPGPRPRRPPTGPSARPPSRAAGRVDPVRPPRRRPRRPHRRRARRPRPRRWRRGRRRVPRAALGGDHRHAAASRTSAPSTSRSAPTRGDRRGRGRGRHPGPDLTVPVEVDGEFLRPASASRRTRRAPAACAGRTATRRRPTRSRRASVVRTAGGVAFTIDEPCSCRWRSSPGRRHQPRASSARRARSPSPPSRRARPATSTRARSASSRRATTGR